jgi:hypothetical protein
VDIANTLFKGFSPKQKKFLFSSAQAKKEFQNPNSAKAGNIFPNPTAS